MGRSPCCEKEGLKRGRWTAEEDDKLRSYIEANGEGSWRSLPKNAGLLRCGKSCRLRWINYLRADLKRGNITPHEDQTILNLHTTLGNRWSLIAGHLPGRTDNEIKNYWNSHLSKKMYHSSIMKNAAEASAIPKRLRRGRPNKLVMLKKNKKAKMALAKQIACPLPVTEESEDKEPTTKEDPGSCCLDKGESSTTAVLCPKAEENNEEWDSTRIVIKERENGLMDITDERGKGSEERESSFWSEEWYSASHSSMASNFDNEWYSASHSSMASNFDNEWLKWEWDEGDFGQNLWSGFTEPSCCLANSDGEREECL